MHSSCQILYSSFLTDSFFVVPVSFLIFTDSVYVLTEIVHSPSKGFGHPYNLCFKFLQVNFQSQISKYRFSTFDIQPVSDSFLVSVCLDIKTYFITEMYTASFKVNIHY